jgi:hypothetical protein
MGASLVGEKTLQREDAAPTQQGLFLNRLSLESCVLKQNCAAG